MRLLSLGVIISVLVSCGNGENEMFLRINKGPAQGSTYSISYQVPTGVDYQRSIDSILFDIDRSLSAWNPKSTLSKFNKGELDSTLDSHFMHTMVRSKAIARETDGAFDMTIGPIVNLWGFGAENRSEIDSAMVDSLLTVVGWQKLQIEKSGRYIRPAGLKVDVNAIAQGYTVDVIANFLDSKNVTDYLIEVGGEMRARGVNLRGEPWVVGIDKPSEEIQQERFQVIIGLDSASLATSGNYRKFWVDEETGVKYSHTIDPSTGYPVRDRLLSVSIIAADCERADAIATACMVMGLDKARRFVENTDDIEGYFVYSGLSGEWEVWRSAGFQKMEK